ncbi:MAG: mitochondrial ribosomal death-associated protein 3-domain-containing protein [Monoraphidium minutum]|nr:MAG: mitochondrial ribosomal death-associated protein 3-domain-containing protein [Monoraphidium minutum]
MRALRCPAAHQAARQLLAWQHGGWAAGAGAGSSSAPWPSDGGDCSTSGRGAARAAGGASSSGFGGTGFASRLLSTGTHQAEGAAEEGDTAVAVIGGGGGAGSGDGALAAADTEGLEPLPRPWHWVEEPAQLADSLLVAARGAELGEEHVGHYYPFDPSLVPEAFQPFHQAFYPPRPPHLQRKGGCRGLQAEFAATGGPHLMWRAATQQLAAALDAAEGSARLLLQGPSGAGKSVAVAALVERARAAGEIVLYVPDARALVAGGFFYKRPGGTTSAYDTIISAQHILKSVLDSHKEQLEALPLSRYAPLAARTGAAGVAAGGDAAAAAAGSDSSAAGGGGGGSGAAGGGGYGTLLDLVNSGLETDDNARLAVSCCLALINELAAAAATPGGPRVLLAVDNYDALYGPTGYGVTATKEGAGGGAYLHRRQLAVEELTLASGMRLLARRNLGGVRVLAATSAAGGARAAEAMRLRRGVVKFDMPRFSAVEVAHLLHFYHERGLAEAPSRGQVDKLRAITNGSGADLRRLGPRSAQLDTNTL